MRALHTFTRQQFRDTLIVQIAEEYDCTREEAAACHFDVSGEHFDAVLTAIQNGNDIRPCVWASLSDHQRYRITHDYRSDVEAMETRTGRVYFLDGRARKA